MRDLCQACGILIWWSNKRIKRTKSGKCLAPKDETCLKTPPFLANYVTVLFMQISILRKRPLQGASTVPKKLFQVWLRVSATKTQKPSFTTQKLEFHYPPCDPIGIYMNIYIYIYFTSNIVLILHQGMVASVSRLFDILVLLARSLVALYDQFRFWILLAFHGM